MTEDTTYNGWTNRATWLVPLWIDNEYGMYKQKQEWLRNADITADTVRDYVGSLITNGMLNGLLDDLADFDSDAIGHRIVDVDWERIAKAWRDEQEEMIEYLKEQNNG